MVVRYPDSSALAALIKLGKQMHAASTYSHVPYSEPEMTKLLANAVVMPEWYYVAAFVRDGAVVGGMVGRMEKYFFAHASYLASDLALYVDPGNRGGVAAKALVADFCRWAEERGAVDVVLSSTASHNPEPAAALFRRLGFEDLGVVTRKGVA